MELVMELIFVPLLKIIFTTIGWVYLFVKFRNLGKMKKEADEKFKGQYSNAGRMVGFYVVVAVCLAALVVLWGTGIYSVVNNIWN